MVIFEMKKRYGRAEMILQAKQGEDSSYQMDVVSPYATSYTDSKLPSLTLPVGAPNTLLEHYVGVQVRNVYTGQQLRKFYSPAADSNSFYGDAPFKYMLDDYTRFKTMEEVLREYVKLVFVRKRGNNFYLQVYDEEARKVLETDALVLVDGVPVFDVNKLMAMDPLKIRKLEVINNTYIFGNFMYDGILHWMSYEHDLAGYELDARALTVDYEALQLKREFYSPIYTEENKMSNRLPDFRNLLFWEPEIVSNGKQDAELSFFSSDLPGCYAIIAEGITTDGVCGSAVKFFEVKDK
jgi:hypothetical protein